MTSMSSSPRRNRTLRVAIFAGFVLAGLSSNVGAEVEELTVRVQDTTARENGEAVVVLRTYAPRPLGSGQMCLRVRHKRSSETTRGAAVTEPFTALLRAEVWSAAGDATHQVTLLAGSEQEVVISFDSSSATVNQSDGPLVALWFAIDGSLAAGEEFELELDPAQTFLTGADGTDLPLRLRGGELRVISAQAPYSLEVEDETVVPGFASIDISSHEGMALSSARFLLTIPTDVSTGRAIVEVLAQHGEVDVQALELSPTTLQIDVVSPFATWGEVPTSLVRVHLPIGAGTPPAFPVALEQPTTSVRDAHGELLTLAIENGLVTVDPNGVFGDGFEHGLEPVWITRGQLPRSLLTRVSLEQQSP